MDRLCFIEYNKRKDRIESVNQEFVLIHQKIGQIF